MKVLVIGGVAADTKVAAKLKRDNYDIQVTILTKSKDISYAGCGLPYYVGNVIGDREDLIVNTPESFSKLTGTEVLTEIEVTKVYPEEKKVEAAPPFSTAIHPFTHTVNALLNKISGELDSITPGEYSEGKAEGYKIVDASINPSIPGATFIDLSKVHGELPQLGKDEKLLLVCTKGKRAYMLQKRLKNFGYTNTLVLEGGTAFNEISL